MLTFKRDNHLEISSAVKQKSPRLSALVFSVSQMTSFSVIILYIYVYISDIAFIMSGITLFMLYSCFVLSTYTYYTDKGLEIREIQAFIKQTQIFILLILPCHFKYQVTFLFFQI